MLDYFLGFLVLYSLYNRVQFFINKKKIGKVPLLRGARPIHYEGGETGVFIIHGLTSSPFEMRYLASFLKERGYSVSVPLLPGHGTIPEDLYTTTWQDWINAAEKDLIEFKKKHKNVFLIGSSNGGVMALHIASRHKELKGVVSMAAPMFFRKNKLLKLLVHVLYLIKINQKKYYFNKRDRRVTKNKAHYKVIPLKSLKECLKLIKVTKTLLPRVSVPALVIQSDTDYQIDINNAKYIYNNLGSKDKKLFIVHNAYHVIAEDPNKKKRQQVFKKIDSFIKKHSK